MRTTPIFLKRNQINDHRWNEVIARSRQGIAYATTWYLDIVCEEWEALVWPFTGEYLIVMPLPVRKKAGILLLYQPVFCQYLGLFSIREINEEETSAFLKSLSTRYSYISAYCFNPENYGLLQKYSWQDMGLHFIEKRTHRIDLTLAYSRLSATYSQDRLRNLRQGLKRKWEIAQCTDPEPLFRLFEENHAGSIPGGICSDAWQKLTRLFLQMSLQADAELWYARDECGIRAGILIFGYAGKSVYIFNAADRFGRRGNARSVMLDLYFRNKAGRDLIFDFESPPVDAIARFYESFGSTAIPFFSISKNELWFPLRQLQNLRKRLLVKTS